MTSRARIIVWGCASAVLVWAFVSGCSGKVIYEGGGAGGMASSGNGSKSVSSSKSTTSSGTVPNLCEDATNKVAAKEKACGVSFGPTGGGGAGGAGGAGQPVCTPADGNRAQAVASCVTSATCAAITGKDAAGSAALNQCIVNASSGG